MTHKNNVTVSDKSSLIFFYPSVLACLETAQRSQSISSECLLSTVKHGNDSAMILAAILRNYLSALLGRVITMNILVDQVQLKIHTSFLNGCAFVKLVVFKIKTKSTEVMTDAYNH